MLSLSTFLLGFFNSINRRWQYRQTIPIEKDEHQVLEINFPVQKTHIVEIVLDEAISYKGDIAFDNNFKIIFARRSSDVFECWDLYSIEFINEIYNTLASHWHVLASGPSLNAFRKREREREKNAQVSFIVSIYGFTSRFPSVVFLLNLCIEFLLLPVLVVNCDLLRASNSIPIHIHTFPSFESMLTINIELNKSKTFSSTHNRYKKHFIPHCLDDCFLPPFSQDSKWHKIRRLISLKKKGAQLCTVKIYNIRLDRIKFFSLIFQSFAHLDDSIRKKK